MTELKGIMAIKAGTEAEFNAVKATLLLRKGELAWETDTQKLSVGDGVTVWEHLTHYSLAATGGGISEATAKVLFTQKNFAANLTFKGEPKLAQILRGINKNEGEWAAEAPFVTRALTGSEYKTVVADVAQVIEISSASEGKVIVTKQTEPYEAGQIMAVCQMGTAKLAVEAGAGMTMKPAAVQKTRAQYSEMLIRFRSATDFVVGGDTE